MSDVELNESGLQKLIADDDFQEEALDNRKTFRIGDLSREFSVTLRTLRFYEDRGLIKPRRAGSTRLYSSKDRQRLKMILLAKRVGFSLVEIDEIMEIYDLGATSDTHIKTILSKFRGQVAVLEKQKEEIVSSLSELQDTIESLEDML